MNSQKFKKALVWKVDQNKLREKKTIDEDTKLQSFFFLSIKK
jgi:hypothetical protein